MGMRVVTCSASSIRGINNFGDELLTQMYGRWIREYDSHIEWHHLTVDAHGILSRETRGMIEEAACLIFTGGGYFADGDHGSRHAVRRHLRALRNRRVYWTVFRQARTRALPCAVVGLEVGPLANPLYRRAVREILLTASPVVVRNGESRSYVRSLCGPSRDTAVCLDAALAGIPGKADQPASMSLDSADFRLGVHVHALDDEAIGAYLTSLLRHLVARVPSDRNARIYYFHDQRKSGSHPSRSVRAEKLVSGLFADVTVVPYLDPVETVSAVGAMDLLVTSKLHLGIVARSLAVPVIAVGGHPKIRRFYESINEGEACADPRKFLSELPRYVTTCLVGEQRLFPIGELFRESALGNRSAVHGFLKSVA